MQVDDIKTINCSTDRTDKHLIIGAGFVGLGIAEALKTAGISYDQAGNRCDR